MKFLMLPCPRCHGQMLPARQLLTRGCEVEYSCLQCGHEQGHQFRDVAVTVYRCHEGTNCKSSFLREADLRRHIKVIHRERTPRSNPINPGQRRVVHWAATPWPKKLRVLR